MYLIVWLSSTKRVNPFSHVDTYNLHIENAPWSDVDILSTLFFVFHMLVSNHMLLCRMYNAQTNFNKPLLSPRKLLGDVNASE